ncbi:hypothetical protein RHMOL_Rhmol02G0308600 [Rhododendron molle]|uniref:Uncharacterized protein n=1 Tax=Rhododendron molle TaxID=49168 RepID=A0ACC0PWJ1_RHOML|nr:hypothetical protein RHMOL_Rhmol02G0308600 [Rhododendron molle]
MEPLCYTKDGEALMKVSSHRNGNTMRAYNVNDSLHREIQVQHNCYYINAIKYEESLIEPTGYDWEEEELRGEVTFTEFWYGKLYTYKKKKRGNGSWEFFSNDERDFEQQNSEEDEFEIDEE